MVLAVAALALVCIFTAAGVSTMNLRLSTQASNSAVAENLAESVVQQALANLQDDLGFADDISITDDPDLPAGARGLLTFDSDRGVPYSSNNLLGENSTGWQRTVPDKMIHLVGVGECGGVTRHVEVVAHVPEFPIAMACGGPIRSKKCFISGFEPEDDRAWESGSGYSTKDEELGPGHIISNSGRPDAVVLDKETKITGDVQSLGGVDINGASVEGEVRAPWGRKAPIPNFNFQKFDPAQSDDTYYENLEYPGDNVTIVGNMRHSGDLTVRKNLTLDNGFLFVDGNLDIKGQLVGEGALVCMGSATFHGATNLASNKDIALLAKNGVTLTGEGANRSVFRGLVYSAGPFSARNLTIVGGFVVNGDFLTDLEDLTVFYSSHAIVPRIKRQSFAVVPRFQIPGQAEREQDLGEEQETGYPFGEWRRYDRTVANVLDFTRPGWRGSSWRIDDPAVIDAVWIDNKPVYRYRYWGRGDFHKYPPEMFEDWGLGGRIPPPGSLPGGGHKFSSAEDLADYWAKENSTGATGTYWKNKGNTPPNKAAYKQYLLDVLNHLEKPTFERQTNFSMDLNEFIVDVEMLRVVLHRTF